MLLVGTSRSLQDIESGKKFVERAAVTALAGDGAGGWYALVDGQVVVRLDADRGTTEAVGQLAEADGQSLAALPDGTVLVGRTGARLSTVRPGAGVLDVPAFQDVPGREGWENPANATPDTRTMAVGPKRWWVNVHVGGVWWSEDVGGTWQAAIEPGADVHEVRTGTDGQVAVAAAVGFGWSQDDGGSWSWTTEGLHAHYLRAVALDAGAAYVSASDGPFTRGGTVYRCRLGAAFERCETGLPYRFDGNVDSGHLDAAGGHVAIGFKDRLYISEDQGESWRVAAVLPDPVTAVRFALA